MYSEMHTPWARRGSHPHFAKVKEKPSFIYTEPVRSLTDKLVEKIKNQIADLQISQPKFSHTQAKVDVKKPETENRKPIKLD